MSPPSWREEAIRKSHDRASFDCGDAQMNEFFRRFARQGHEQNVAKTFCAIDNATPDRVLGFYTIAPASIVHDAAPQSMTGAA
jgi:hypothetical protein